MTDSPIVVCILSGGSEACDSTCPMFKKCWNAEVEATNELEE